MKARKGAPKKRISGVRPSESAKDSAQTLPAFEPIERRALPFDKPFDRRRRVKLDPATRISAHASIPPPAPAASPASAAPPASAAGASPSAPRPNVQSPQPTPPPAVPTGSLVLVALLLVTAVATALAWLIWGA